MSQLLSVIARAYCKNVHETNWLDSADYEDRIKRHDSLESTDGHKLKQSSFSVIGFRFFRICRFYRITRKLK